MSQEQEREANFAGLCKQLYPRLEVADSVFVEALRKHGDEGLAMEEVANWQPWESSADLSPAAPPAAAPKPSAPADVDNIERQRREFEKFEKANQERIEKEKKEKAKEEAERREAARREEEARLLEQAKREEKAKQLEKERLAREEEQRRAREERAILARMERERAKAEELLKAKLKEEEEKKLKELQDKIDKERRIAEERARLEKEKEEKEKRDKEEKEKWEKMEREKIEREIRERLLKEEREKREKEEQAAKEKRDKEEQAAKEKREKEEKEAKERREKEEQEAKEKRDKEEQEAREKREKEEEEARAKAKAKEIEDAKGKEKEEQDEKDKEVGDIIKELQDLKGMNVDFVGENAPPRVSIYVGKESDLSAADHQRIKDVFIKKEISEKEIRILDIATDREIQQFLKSSLKQDPLVFPIVCVDGQPIGIPAEVFKMEDAQIEKLLSSTPEDPLFHTSEDDPNSEVHLGALNQVLSAGEYLASGVSSLLMLPVTALTWPFRSASVDTDQMKGKNDVEFDVIHTNWYWRSQWRVFRFTDTYVARLHPRHRDIRAAHQYETIRLIQVTDPKNIVFHYSDNSPPDYLHAKEEDVKEMVRIVKAKNESVKIQKGEE